MIELLKNKFNLNDNNISVIKKYYDFLITENNKYNLTRITNFNDFLIKHIFDSYLGFEDVDLENKSVLDIGSGAGFPGILLAIKYENANFYLIESIRKKANFLNETIKLLNLKNVIIINDRCENLPKKRKYDYITARAVTNLDTLLKYAYPIINLNGSCIFYKSINYQLELDNAKNNKFSLEKILEKDLPESKGKRYILHFKIKKDK